jgi:hypothetical protein
LGSARERFARAWGLVDPSVQAGIKLRAGQLSREAALATTWKAPIDAEVSIRDLREVGVNINDVCAAIRFYTATDATIQRTTTGYRVTALGYGRGPAR